MPARLLRRLPAGLVRRLAIVNLVALVPLSTLALLQTRDLVAEVDASQSRAAMGRTVQAAQPQIKLIGAAQTLAQTLAALVPGLGGDSAACIRLMDDSNAAHPEFTLVGYIPMSGMMTCASGGRVFDLSSSQIFSRLSSAPEPRLVLSRIGPVSGVPVLAASHPVFGADGSQTGIVTVSVPHQAVVAPDTTAPAGLQEAPTALTTFDRQGAIVTSSVGIEVASFDLPAHHDLVTLAEGRTARTFTDLSRAGHELVFAVVPITPELFLIGSWAPARDQALLDPRIAPFLLAALTMVSGLIAAAFAAERLVIRHVRTLSAAMGAFAAGARSGAGPELEDPPAEIAELAESYGAMIETILHDEAELENLLRQKEQLLRELHHRTGNSLQLIASILRMHLRESPEEPVRQVLTHLLERVMSLSTVHMGLYRMAGSVDVPVDELIADVIGKVDALHARDGIPGRIRHRLQPLMLASHQAVPLALLLAEVLAAFLDPPASQADTGIEVRMETEPGNFARLSVTGPARARVRLTGSGGEAPDLIAARLIRAFVRQIEGEMALTPQGERIEFGLRFLARQGAGEPAALPFDPGMQGNPGGSAALSSHETPHVKGMR